MIHSSATPDAESQTVSNSSNAGIVGRRSIVKSVVWSTPVVLNAVAVPLAAASSKKLSDGHMCWNNTTTIGSEIARGITGSVNARVHFARSSGSATLRLSVALSGGDLQAEENILLVTREYSLKNYASTGSLAFSTAGKKTLTTGVTYAVTFWSEGLDDQGRSIPVIEYDVNPRTISVMIAR